MKGPSTDRNDLGPMQGCARCGNSVARKTMRVRTDGEICVRCSMAESLEQAVRTTPYNPDATTFALPDFRKRAIVRRWRGGARR